MRYLVAAVGRFGSSRKAGPERDLYEHFAARILPRPTLKEIEEKRPLPVAERCRREGERLLASIPKGAFTIVLDEAGTPLSSREFAERLRGLGDRGTRDVAFLIGGADGLDGAVTARADFVLSLGPMTWPHLMVRGLLAEQLFRAQCVLAGHPYHRA